MFLRGAGVRAAGQILQNPSRQHDEISPRCSPLGMGPRTAGLDTHCAWRGPERESQHTRSCTEAFDGIIHRFAGPESRRLFPDFGDQSRRRLHTRRAHRRPKVNRANGRRIYPERRDAEHPRARSAQRRKADGADAEEGRRNRPARWRNTGRVRRLGPRQNLGNRSRRKAGRLRLLRCLTRRPLRHRHRAHRLFRHRRTEEKISPQDRLGRAAVLLLPVGTAGRLGFARGAHARGALRRRQELGC